MHKSADAVLMKGVDSVGETIWMSLKSGKLVFWVRSNGRTGNDLSPDPDKMRPRHGMPTIPECPRPCTRPPCTPPARAGIGSSRMGCLKSRRPI
jgi:hypothetical protein